MKKKYLITGGAGFIGSALARNLIDDSEEVIIVDKLTYASSAEALTLLTKSKNVTFLEQDICDEISIKKTFETYRPNKIIHLAAESHVDNSIKEPRDFIFTNIVGTYNLLVASTGLYESLTTDEKVSFTFHHVSTDEVFGDLIDKKSAADEDFQYKPSSPYSASKASSDHLVEAWGRTYKLPTLITNCSNNYGPFQHKEKFIPTIINSLIERKQIPIYGVGNQIRDWLYVEDHAKALIKVSNEATAGSKYNISGRNETTNIMIVAMVIKAFKSLSKIEVSESWPENLIQHVDDRPGHDERYALNSDRISKELGWDPQTDLESGIYKTVKWYLRNSKDNNS